MYRHCLITTIVASFLAGHAMASTLFETNFDSAAVQIYADGATINASGPITSQLLVGSPLAGDVVSVIDLGGGDHAMALTNNDADVNGPRATGSFTSTSNATLYGQVDITPLSVSSGLRSNLLFQITQGGTGPASVIDLQINPAGIVSIVGGNGVQAGSNDWEGPATQGNLYALTLDATYRLSFEIDLVNTPNNGTLTMTNLADASDTFSASWNTRLLDGQPVDTLRFRNGSNPNNLSPDPSHLINNVILQTTPIPEPGSLILLAAGGALMLSRRRK